MKPNDPAQSHNGTTVELTVRDEPAEMSFAHLEEGGGFLDREPLGLCGLVVIFAKGCRGRTGWTSADINAALDGRDDIAPPPHRLSGDMPRGRDMLDEPGGALARPTGEGVPGFLQRQERALGERRPPEHPEVSLDRPHSRIGQEERGDARPDPGGVAVLAVCPASPRRERARPSASFLVSPAGHQAGRSPTDTCETSPAGRPARSTPHRMPVLSTTEPLGPRRPGGRSGERRNNRWPATMAEDARASPGGARPCGPRAAPDGGGKRGRNIRALGAGVRG